MMVLSVRIERAIGELRAEQNQGIGVHHRVKAGGETDKTGHSDVVGVIVLDVLFAAQGVNNRGFQLLSKAVRLRVCSCAAAAAQ